VLSRQSKDRVRRQTSGPRLKRWALLTQSLRPRTISHRLCLSDRDNSSILALAPDRHPRPVSVRASPITLPRSSPPRRSEPWTSPKKKPTAVPQWKSSTTSSPSVIVRSHPLPYLPLSHHPPDESFAAKHMPDLGHDVKDFKVYTWRLTNWKKLEKKITSPEFDCGGHRWSAPSLLPSQPLTQPHSLPGAYSYSLSETQTHPLMIPSQCTWTTQIRKSPQRVGTPARSLRSSYQMSMTPQYTPSAVSLTRPSFIPLPIPLLHKMPTIVSSPRSAIGVSLALASCANCSTSKKVTSVQLSKKNVPMSPCTFAYLKIPPASCGITLSSNVLFPPLIITPLILTDQLRFKEGDWLRRLEKPRCHLLYEFTPPVSVLHPLLQKGTSRWRKITLCSHQHLGGVPDSYRG